MTLAPMPQPVGGEGHAALERAGTGSSAELEVLKVSKSYGTAKFEKTVICDCSFTVAEGKLTDSFATLEEWAAEQGMDLAFVINRDYTEKIGELIEHARKNSSATSEPAYRMLQVLTHLRGAAPSL